MKKIITAILSLLKEPRILTAEQLNKSVPYVDHSPIEEEENINLFIDENESPMLVDRFTGKEMFWLIGYEIESSAILALKKKLGLIREECKANFEIKEPILN